MVLHSLRVLLRQFLRHRLTTLISLLSLTVGVTATILITLFSQHHLTYDSFHKNGDRLQLVYKERHLPTGVQNLTDTWIPLGDLMQRTYPEIVANTRIFGFSTVLRIDDSEVRVEDCLGADPNFLQLFSFPLLEGDPATALERPTSVVVSRPFALREFGTDKVVGKLIQDTDDISYTITGVLADIPEASTYRPEVIFPFRALISEQEEQEAEEDWGGSFLFTWVLLDKSSDAAGVETKLPALVEKQFGEDGPNGSNNMNFRFLALKDLHDWETGTRSIAWTLLAFAAVILLIASINFTNLATARSLQRAREVGMRKVLGAGRADLVRGFLLESTALSLLAMGVSWMLVELLLPWMNQLVQLHLTFSPLHHPQMLAAMFLLALGIGVASGFYPAIVLSGYKPVSTLKGEMVRGPRSTLLRDSLLVAQFALSIALMVATIVVWQQIQFMKNANLNLDNSSVITITASPDDFASEGNDGTESMRGLVNGIEKLPGVDEVSLSMSAPGRYRNANVFARPVPWEGDAPLRWLYTLADDEFFPLYEMDIVAGRNWDPQLESDHEGKIILNETAARETGWGAEDAVGKSVHIGQWDLEVIGVVRDYHYASLNETIRPVVHLYEDLDSQFKRIGFINVRLAQGDVRPTLDAIQALWAERQPQMVMQFEFVDERYASLYEEQERIGTLASSFAVLAVLIASIGLLGLVSYSVTRRTREIGIRRVLGAENGRLIALLVRGFLRPVLLANLIAWPLAWLMMKNWLQEFPYRSTLGWQPFLLSAGLALLVAGVTLVLQASRATRANPADVLRYE